MYSSAGAQSYRVIDIDNAITGSGSGITNDTYGSVALGLNSSDQVVGYYNYGSSLQQIPFVYNAGNGTVTALNNFSSGYLAQANAINDAGIVVGSGTVGSGYLSGFVYNSASGAFTAVSPLGPGNNGSDFPYLNLRGINSAGTAVGYSFTANNANSYRAITYNAASGTGVVTNIGDAFSGPVIGSTGTYGSRSGYTQNNAANPPNGLSGNSNEGYSINNSGMIAGWGPNTGGVSNTGTGSTVQDLYIATPNASSGTYTTSGFKDINAAVLSASNSTSTSFTGSWDNVFIDAAGNVAGTGYANQNTHSFLGFFYNAATGTAVTISAGTLGTTFVNGIADVNGVPVIVGTASVSGGYYDGFVYENGVTTDISALIPGYTITSANGINSNGDIVATGTPTSGGASHALLLELEGGQSVTYTGAHSNVWGSSAVNFSPSNYTDGDAVVFNDSATGSTNVTIASTVSPASVTFNNSSKSYVISGAPISSSYSINGGTFLNVTGGGSVTLNSSNTYVGVTNVSSGKLTLGVTGALPINGQLMIGASGSVVLANQSASTTVLQLSSLSIAGTSGGWTGKLDLSSNDLILHNSSIGTITNQLAQGYANGTWNATGGIISTAAASNSSHLTALGVIVNDTKSNTTGAASGTALYASLDGASTTDGDILVKCTYYGDTNLSGSVDGSDYANIDNGYENGLTGWYNGDFNYDGAVNGSDYTLMDNAFNSQGSNLGGGSGGPTVEIAAQIAGGNETSAVPEPAALGLLSAAVLGALCRRPRVKRGMGVMSDTSLFGSTEL
jgi:hypothetical protein